LGPTGGVEIPVAIAERKRAPSLLLSRLPTTRADTSLIVFELLAVAAMFKHKKLDFQSFARNGQSEFFVALKDYDAASAVLEFLGLEA
jgi:hypothetical protein